MNKKIKDGKYAEIINEIAEHIYQDDIEKTERRAKISFPDGNKREIDLLVTLKNKDKIAFEVRDRDGNQGVDWVDQVIGKYKNVDFAKVWICTFGNSYLTKDAIRTLKYNNIGWRNINVNNADEISKEPVLFIDAIKTIDDDSDMEINGEKYKELMIGCMDEKGNIFDISLRKQLLMEINSIITSDFDSYLNKNYIEYTTTMDIGAIENNFDSTTIKIKITLPLIHYSLCDYFSEKYIVSDNDKEDYLLATKNKSIFITDKFIVLNFSYLSKLRNEGYIISNHYIIRMTSIPEKYRKKNKMRIIDVDGNSQDTLLKVIGYKQ
jgi:uncharacterized protein YciU (UPF0263 family)